MPQAPSPWCRDTLRLVVTLLIGMTLPLASSLGHASDGQLEINQTCAEASGCFPGDRPGFPVEIIAPGSYRLTSNLDNGLDVDLISIQTSHVSLDLGGFRLRCRVVVFPPLTSLCNGASTGSTRGVAVDDANLRTGISVHDGTIVGMRAAGVELGGDSRVTGLRVSQNAGAGIDTGQGGNIEDNTIFDNGGAGIAAGAASRVVGNTVRSNDGTGIVGPESMNVRTNTVFENGFAGIVIGAAGIVVDNTVQSNTQTGILVLDAGRVAGNTVLQNGSLGISAGTGSRISDNTVQDNVGSGIVTQDEATITGNSVESNGGSGIQTGNASVVSANSASGHPSFGIATGTRSLVERNVVNGNTTGGLSLGSATGYRANNIGANGIPSVSGGETMGDNLFCFIPTSCSIQ